MTSRRKTLIELILHPLCSLPTTDMSRVPAASLVLVSASSLQNMPMTKSHYFPRLKTLGIARQRLVAARMLTYADACSTEARCHRHSTTRPTLEFAIPCGVHLRGSLETGRRISCTRFVLRLWCWSGRTTAKLTTAVLTSTSWPPIYRFS